MGEAGRPAAHWEPLHRCTQLVLMEDTLHIVVVIVIVIIIVIVIVLTI